MSDVYHEINGVKRRSQCARQTRQRALTRTVQSCCTGYCMVLVLALACQVLVLVLALACGVLDTRLEQ